MKKKKAITNKKMEALKERKEKACEALRLFKEWLIRIREETEEEFPQASNPTMRDLIDFAKKSIEDTPNGYQRVLWLKDGGKLRSIKAILYDGKRIILEASDEKSILIPKYL